MREYTLNMLSHADQVKGQGVLSAYEEELALVTGRLDRLEGDGDDYRIRVRVNARTVGDVTHIHTVNPEFFLQLPLIKAKGIAVGSVHFLPETMDQSLHIPRLFRKVFYSYLIQFYKSMDHLVTVNPCFIPKLAAYGIDPEKVTYIPNYVSAKRFSRVDEQRKKELRREWGLDPERFTVVCAGQLQTRKGVMEFAQIAERLPQMQFVWAGNFAFGNMSDGHRELEQLLQNHPKNLLFTGLVDREKMPQIYQMGDVMLLPSFDELFPMTVLEAMSCGLPILLRDLDLYRVILDGYYLKAQDNDGFVEQLLSLSTDSEYYARALQMSGEGNAFYSEEHVLSMWRQFYHQVMEESIRKQETFRKPLKRFFRWRREEQDEQRTGKALRQKPAFYCGHLFGAVCLAAAGVQPAKAVGADPRGAPGMDSGSGGADGALLAAGSGRTAPGGAAVCAGPAAGHYLLRHHDRAVF